MIAHAARTVHVVKNAVVRVTANVHAKLVKEVNAAKIQKSQEKVVVVVVRVARMEIAVQTLINNAVVAAARMVNAQVVANAKLEENANVANNFPLNKKFNQLIQKMKLMK